jgi:hypothetical protein
MPLIIFLSKKLLIIFYVIFLQSYLWDNNQAVVQWLTSQLDESDGTIVADSLIGSNIKSVRKDAVINQVTSTVNVNMIELNINIYFKI